MLTMFWRSLKLVNMHQLPNSRHLHSNPNVPSLDTHGLLAQQSSTSILRVRDITGTATFPDQAMRALTSNLAFLIMRPVIRSQLRPRASPETGQSRKCRKTSISPSCVLWDQVRLPSLLWTMELMEEVTLAHNQRH